MTFSKEELEAAVERSVDDLKEWLRMWVLDGQTPAMCPFVMMVLRQQPDFQAVGLPLDFKALGESKGTIPISIFNPNTLRGPDDDVLSKEDFWQLMKFISIKVNAYALILGYEAWYASGSDRTKLPVNLADHPEREEAAVITVEREGTRRLMTAKITRDPEGKPQVGEWAEPQANIQGRTFNAIAGNVQN